MSTEWHRVEGNGWLTLGDYGRINPREWGSGIDRHVFTAEHPRGGLYLVEGESTPGTFTFEFDERYVLRGGPEGPNLEIEISALERGQYGVRYRDYEPPAENTAWSGE